MGEKRFFSFIQKMEAAVPLNYWNSLLDFINIIAQKTITFIVIAVKTSNDMRYMQENISESGNSALISQL
jgi:hypothetical protein